ncbi:hypothetical protein SCUCBS95973_006722 [Sporothrix curviconia]|uniref:Uncharacterized protein n=1 Tax=Sporothrix curviconia TaxID=1260050 RepID=A0ABP0C7T1_9PEZI
MASIRPPAESSVIDRMTPPTPEEAPAEVIASSMAQEEKMNTSIISHEVMPAPMVTQGEVSKPDDSKHGHGPGRDLRTRSISQGAHKTPTHSCPGTDGDKARVQAAGPQLAAIFDSFPPEYEIERLAELDRPPSRDSHARYYIVEAARSDKAED